MESEEQHNKIKKLEARIEMLELYSHPPIGWEERIKNLEKSMKKLFNKEK